MQSDVVDEVLTSPEAGGKIIRGSVWRVGGNAAGVVVGLATATLVLRYLGVAESGRYVTVLSLVAIALSVADAGLNITSSRELALREPKARTALIANLLGLRLVITPVALLAIFAFALIAGYPTPMLLGTLLAGGGLFIVSLADAVLLRLTVQLRNAGLAFIDFLKQIVVLAGVALLVVVGARLTAFFAMQIVVGIVVVAVTPLVGAGRFPLPRFDRAEQRALLTRSLPLAAAVVLAQLYVRLVIVLMSLISSAHQIGYFGGSLREMESLATIPLLVVGVALPLLTAAARDDRARLRYAVESLGKGAIVAGVLVVHNDVHDLIAVMEGKGLAPKSIHNYRKALKAAKLDEAHTFHHLRHTFGTRMAAAGVSMRTLQEWMGHRDIATTQLYADYAPSAREAELVAAAFARETNDAPVSVVGGP